MKKNTPDTERLCRYCELASPLHDEEQMLCRKRGIVSSGYVCRAFRYDPLKRDPGAPPEAPKLEYISLEDGDSPSE